MRNAMTNGFIPYMPVESGGPAVMRIDPFGDASGMSTPGAFGMNFNLGGGSRGATQVAPVTPISAAMQRTQDFAPIPTLADMPAMPTFSTMTPFQPYQGFQGRGASAGGPRNAMLGAGYAPPPQSPFGRYRTPSTYGTYGSGAYGGTYGNAGGFNPYENMF